MNVPALIVPAALISACTMLAALPGPAAEGPSHAVELAPLTLRVRVIEIKADRADESQGLAVLREVMVRGPALLPEALGADLGQGLRDRFTPAEIEADYMAAQLLVGTHDVRTQIGATRIAQGDEPSVFEHRDYGIILDARNDGGQIRFRFEASLPGDRPGHPGTWHQLQARGELPAQPPNRTWLIAAGRYPGRGEVIVLAAIGDATGQR